VGEEKKGGTVPSGGGWKERGAGRKKFLPVSRGAIRFAMNLAQKRVLLQFAWDQTAS